MSETHWMLPTFAGVVGLALVGAAFLAVDAGGAESLVLSTALSGVGVPWVLLAAVAFPATLFGFLLLIRATR